MSKLTVDTIEPSTGTTVTLGASGDTFTVPSGVTLSGAGAITVPSGGSLTIDSGATITNNGTASGFGKVLQVVSATYATQESTTSTTFVATSLSASITPSSASNKILALLELPMSARTTANSVRNAAGTLFRDATNLGNATYGMGVLKTGTQNGDWDGANIGTCYLDSPSTTSSITYTAYYSTVDADTAYAFIENALGTLTLMEIAA